jgi:iron complex transport system permease protein
MSDVRYAATGSALLAAALLVVATAALAVGTSGVSLADLSASEPARLIVMQIRLPRIVVAALCGGILALAGLTFQTLLRNPLADPFILGVSGGAAAGAAIGTAGGLAGRAGVLPLLAFAGACVATAAVLLLGVRRGRIDAVRLLLAGLVLNAFFSASILLAFSFSRSTELTVALRWMMGSFFAASWGDAALLGGAMALAAPLLAFHGQELRLLVFGEDDARALGVRVDRLRVVAFVTASLATGAAVAVAGVIGFVGLLVPHAIRLVARRDFRVLLPLSILGGALLLVAADTLARVIAGPAELPVGALTALLGVPFFLLVLRRG